MCNFRHVAECRDADHVPRCHRMSPVRIFGSGYTCLWWCPERRDFLAKSRYWNSIYRFSIEHFPPRLDPRERRRSASDVDLSKKTIYLVEHSTATSITKTSVVICIDVNRLFVDSWTLLRPTPPRLVRRLCDSLDDDEGSIFIHVLSLLRKTHD